MWKTENQCVGCETCTLGRGCPLLNVSYCECDSCGDDAEYRIDGKDYCRNCAVKYLDEMFYGLPIDEKADLLGVSFEIID